VAALAQEFSDSADQALLVVASREDGAALTAVDLEALSDLAPEIDAATGGSAAGPIPSEDGEAAVLTSTVEIGDDHDAAAHAVDALREVIADHIVLVLEKVFDLSRSKLFAWFFWIYNAGVILTSATLIWHGSLTVLGLESSKAISGIAGTGHVLLTAGMVLLFVALGRALRRTSAPQERMPQERMPQAQVAARG
jgi:uncharacterized membrane protein YgdD (TMEM256/DUF423 family)